MGTIWNQKKIESELTSVHSFSFQTLVETGSELQKEIHHRKSPCVNSHSGSPEAKIGKET